MACSKVALSSAESRPIAGVTTSGTPPAARSASVISMMRAAALSAFWVSSRRTASVRACEIRVLATCSSVCVSRTRARNWFWILVMSVMAATTPWDRGMT